MITNAHMAELWTLWRRHGGRERVSDPERLKRFVRLAEHDLVTVARPERVGGLATVDITLGGQIEVLHWRDRAAPLTRTLAEVWAEDGAGPEAAA